MNDVLDDLESRPGSTTSLLRTVVGSVLRAQGGWASSADLVALMETVDVPGGRTRTALTRLKAKGLLVAETRDRTPGYAVAAAALPMLERGDRRIYSPRIMQEGDPWCLVSFSVPEENRDLRHQLRRRLSWIGCGTVSGALWICPGHLVEEVEGIVDRLGLTGRVTAFLVAEIRGATEPSVAVARWWDLEMIRGLHDDFLAGHADAMASFGADPQPRTAFRTWIRALDAWRTIPYLDPGLPPGLLPADWPGARSIPLFLELRDAVGPLAEEYVASLGP